MLPDNELVKERLRKLDEIKEKEINPYPYSYGVTHRSDQIHEKHSKLKAEDQTEDHVKVAGRIVGLRRMGKASFVHILDNDGKLQLYLQQDELGKENYKFLKKCDLGDFIGAQGTIFKTRTGETTVKVKAFELLSKAVRPLPEKFHGLSDAEARYRKRYLDLVSNPEVKEVFKQRSLIMNSVRKTMLDRGFLEVETPTLQPIYGGALARPFISKLNLLDMTVYMRVSPELYLKRLLVGGYEKVFEIGKSFRNEGCDRSHNPEFTMMECYQAYVDYNEMMGITEECYVNAAKAVHGSTRFTYQGREFDVKAPWPRLTMKEALIKYAQLDVDKLSLDELKQQCRAYAINIEGDQSKGVMMELLFEELVEDKLIDPVFVIDYPLESTPLCKPKRGDPELCERFEPYMCGMELGNAYSELNDPILQRKLFEEQAASLRAAKGEAHPLDEDYLESMEHGMPPAGGLGLGVDRLIMLLTNQNSIRDIIFFPFMKLEMSEEEKKKAGMVTKQ